MLPLDLNLIRVFVAIYEAQSVSLAAERLNVTQPTASYSLSRLRALLQDQLFIRSREGMLPTPQADRIYSGFIAALRGIDQTVEAAREFDPASSARRFTLAMSDIGEMIFLPPILRKLQILAPEVKLEIVQVPLEDLARRLATGEITAAVGNFSLAGPSIRHAKLFEEHYVCLLARRQKQPPRALTLDGFRNGRHVHVGSAPTGHVMIEEALRDAGIDRHIVLSIAHFANLSHVIANSDLMAIVPSRVATLFESYENVRSAPVPVPIPSFDVQMVWNGNDDTTAANAWLRRIISESLKDAP